MRKRIGNGIIMPINCANISVHICHIISMILKNISNKKLPNYSGKAKELSTDVSKVSHSQNCQRLDNCFCTFSERENKLGE